MSGIGVYSRIQCSPYKSGDVYNDLMLTGKCFMASKKPQGTQRFIECICKCGKVFFTRLYNIKNGATKSCGCRRTEEFITRNTTHGFSTIADRHPLYSIWASMIQRCYYEHHASYHNYGAIGITVCHEWRNDFKPFYDWAIVNGWEKGLDLDKDILYKQKFGTEGKMYCPEYCCFATRTENSRAKKTNHLIEAFGEIKCIADWVDDDRCVVTYGTLATRINRGWDVENAISLPLKKAIK